MSEQEQPLSFVRNTSTFVEQQLLGEATSQIQYVSQGHCLVIGDPARALSVAQPLAGTGFTVVHIEPSAVRVEKNLTEHGVAVFTVPSLVLNGHLGSYRATVLSIGSENHESFDLGVSAFRESGCFDLVLDLSQEPLMPMRLPPFGYYHGSSEEATRAAISEIVELRGEFEKPRFFNYNDSICAHSRSELQGCNRCIDVCATGAITAQGEGVAIDPFLCQGCGSCATVCPSGAMTYAYPRPVDAIQRTRAAMASHSGKILVLHTEQAQSFIDAAGFTDEIVPMLVEEVSAFGPDYWLALLAGPASRIYVVIDSPEDDPNREALNRQIDWVTPLLSALGVDEVPISLCQANEFSTLLGAQISSGSPSHDDVPSAGSAPSLGDLVPRDFATHGDKRQTIRLALDAISEQFTPIDTTVDLPAHAPFGSIEVDTQACTLCMACASICPAKALLDGQEMPALRFVEANCLQCGLCQSACPESAITLHARYTWDSIEARKIRTLHQEEPFHCERCHKAFATRAMIDTMTEKLTGHWMFKDPKAVRRLRLCGDCRVIDMFADDAAGIALHKEKT